MIIGGTIYYMSDFKRRTVAITTVIAMAFVMVASMIPAIMAKADEYNEITNVEYSFTPPSAGEIVEQGEGYENLSLRPDISTSTEGVYVYDGPNRRINTPAGFFVNDTSLDESGEYIDLFAGTFEEGKTYYAWIHSVADVEHGYKFADNISVTVSNANVIGTKVYNYFDPTYQNSEMHFLISFTVSAKEPTPTPDPEPTSEAISDSTQTSVVASDSTQTSVATSATASTTKATAPKTADDALPYAGLAFVFVGISAIGVIACRRKNL